MSFTPRRRATWLCLAAIAPSAHALEADLALSNTAEYTTNTARTETDEVEEWVNTPGVELSLTQEGAALDLDSQYRLQRRMYERDLFDDETVLTGQTELLWRALPERLDFTVRNVRTESTERARVPNVEDNRQTVSTTEAGPTLRLRPQSNAELQISYLYSDLRAEETDTDSHRHTGTAQYVVELSPIRTLTLAASNTRVQFDNPVAPDLDVRLGEVTFDHRGNRLEYTLTGGYNETRRNQDRDTVDGAVGELSVRWNATSETSLQLAASRRIVDHASRLTTGILDFGDSVDEDTDLNEVFTETMGRVALASRLGNNDVVLALSAGEEDYEDALRDSERQAVSATLGRDLTPRTSLRAVVEFGRRKFTDEDDEYDEIRGTLELTRQMTRRFEVVLGVHYDERDPRGDGGFAYDEWVGRLQLRYHLLGGR
jgi:hypothetical protein